ncbi:MAG TPA: sugar phosphate isomerase/epimerase [Verrucomicrobiota bacterium]|nr:sugar phosphate isomerase/epimerase [Verrucomicrobiota bacterium]
MKLILALAITLLLTGTTASPAADQSPENAATNRFRGPVGLQLYSLRDEFAKDVQASLFKAHNLGFHFVELAGTYGKTPEEFRNMMRAAHIQPIAGHFSYDRFRDDPEGVAKEAKALGLRFAGVAWIPHESPFNEEKAREAIKVFNRAGEVLSQHNIGFYYHNHGYEFQPHGDGTLFDLIVAETKPEWVSFQMDVLWVVLPGQDPAKLMEKYAGRWSTMHLKDLKKGVATGSLSGKTDNSNSVPIGEGQTDWPALLRAAQKAGVKFYFVEDESPDVLEQLPKSANYLRQVRF